MTGDIGHRGDGFADNYEPRGCVCSCWSWPSISDRAGQPPPGQSAKASRVAAPTGNSILAGNLEVGLNTGQFGVYTLLIMGYQDLLIQELFCIHRRATTIWFRAMITGGQVPAGEMGCPAPVGGAGMPGQPGRYGGPPGAGRFRGPPPPPPPYVPGNINHMPQQSSSMWSNNSGTAVVPGNQFGQGSYYVPDPYIRE